MTVGCRDARAPDVDGAAETPDCLTMDVTRAGAARAGIDTPEAPPPRICAPAAKQAKRVTIAVPAIWTFQFISLYPTQQDARNTLLVAAICGHRERTRNPRRREQPCE